MLGIGRKIKKIYLKKILNLIKNYIPKKLYSLIDSFAQEWEIGGENDLKVSARTEEKAETHKL